MKHQERMRRGLRSVFAIRTIDLRQTVPVRRTIVWQQVTLSISITPNLASDDLDNIFKSGQSSWSNPFHLASQFLELVCHLNPLFPTCQICMAVDSFPLVVQVDLACWTAPQEINIPSHGSASWNKEDSAQLLPMFSVKVLWPYMYHCCQWTTSGSSIQLSSGSTILPPTCKISIPQRFLLPHARLKISQTILVE